MFQGNKLLVSYDNRKFTVHIELNGGTCPLVNCHTPYALQEFYRQARSFVSWEWLEKLMLDGKVKDIAKELRANACTCDDLSPVSQEQLLELVKVYPSPPDDTSLEGWVDDIFFGAPSIQSYDPSQEVVEYATGDFTQRRYEAAGSTEYPHIRVPGASVVVDYDGVTPVDLSKLPTPTKVMKRPGTERCHILWEVTGFATAKALRWAKDIAGRYAALVGGDVSYPHAYMKNPDFPGWEVTPNDNTYELSDLNEYATGLNRKRWELMSVGKGRNETLFRFLDGYAAGQLYVSKSDAMGDLTGAAEFVGTMGLSRSEVNGICRSVARRYFAGRCGSGRKQSTGVGRGGFRLGAGRKRGSGFITPVRFDFPELEKEHSGHGGNRTGTGRKRSYTQEQEMSIIQWKGLGKSVAWIVDEVGLSRNTVNRILKNAPRHSTGQPAPTQPPAQEPARAPATAPSGPPDGTEERPQVAAGHHVKGIRKCDQRRMASGRRRRLPVRQKMGPPGCGAWMDRRERD